MAVSQVIVRYISAQIDDRAGSILALDEGGPVTRTGAMLAFLGRLEGAPVRSRGDGTAPTTSNGEFVDIGTVIALSEGELEGKQFIRAGSQRGVIRGHIYRNRLSELPMLPGLQPTASPDRLLPLAEEQLIELKRIRLGSEMALEEELSAEDTEE